MVQTAVSQEVESIVYDYDSSGNRVLRNFTTKSMIEDDSSNLDRITPQAEALNVPSEELPSAELDFVNHEVTLKMFPNPVKDKLTVQVTAGELDKAVMLQVTNTSGQVVKSEQLTDNIHLIDTSDLSSGLYVLTAVLEEETLNWSLVKQ